MASVIYFGGTEDDKARALVVEEEMDAVAEGIASGKPFRVNTRGRGVVYVNPAAVRFVQEQP